MLMNGGTVILRPVSSVAGLYWAWAVGALHGRLGLDHLELDRRRQFQVERLALVESSA